MAAEATSPTLLAALRDTLQKDKSLREAAEQILSQACSTQGYTVELLKILVSTSFPREIRQAAAVALKNAMANGWSKHRTIRLMSHDNGEEDENEDDENGVQSHEVPSAISTKSLISKEDKRVLRGSLFDALVLVRQDTSLKAFVCECVGIAAQEDLIKNVWPEFYGALRALLERVDDASMVAAGVLALRRVAKGFQQDAGVVLHKKNSKSSKKQTPEQVMEALVSSQFPVLLQIGEELMKLPCTEDHAVPSEITKLIGKIFYSSVAHRMPKAFLLDWPLLERWYAFFMSVLYRALPPSQAAAGDEIDDLSLRPWWKTKKAALECCQKLFYEHGSPQYLGTQSTHEESAFAHNFVERKTLASASVLASLSLLDGWVKGQQTPKRVLHLCLIHVSTGLEPAKTYKPCVLPHAEFLIKSVIFKCLVFTEEDEQEWEDEPLQAANAYLAPTEDLFNLKASAGSCLVDACKLRSKDFLDMSLEFFVHASEAAPTPGQRDAAYFALGVLSSLLAPNANDVDDEFDLGEKSSASTKKLQKMGAKRAAKYAGKLERMLALRVVPALHPSVTPHLRARAAWCVSRYAHIAWTDEGIVRDMLLGVLQCLADGTPVPVRATAASALTSFFVLVDKNDRDSPPEEWPLVARVIRAVVQPDVLREIVTQYLKIMAEIGATHIVRGLEALIDAFHGEVAFLALDICRAVVQAFDYYVQKSNEEEDAQGGDALGGLLANDSGANLSLAALSCLDTIISLLDVCSTNADAMRAMQPVVLPLIARVLADDDLDSFIESSISMYSFFTYYVAPPFVEEIWTCAHLVLALATGNYEELVSEICVPLEHLVLRDNASLLARGFHVELFKLCDATLSIVERDEEVYFSPEKDVRAVLSLLSYMYQTIPAPNEFCCLAMPRVMGFFKAWVLPLGGEHDGGVSMIATTRARFFVLLASCWYHSPVHALQGMQAAGLNLTEVAVRIPACLPDLHAKTSKMVAIGLLSLLNHAETKPVLLQQDERVTALLLHAAIEAVYMHHNKVLDEADEDYEDDDEDDDEDDEDFNNDEPDDEYGHEDDAKDPAEANYLAFVKHQRENLDLDEFGEKFDESPDPDDYPWVLADTNVDQGLRTSIHAMPRNVVETAAAKCDNDVQQGLARILQGLPMLPEASENILQEPTSSRRVKG